MVWEREFGEGMVGIRVVSFERTEKGGIALETMEAA